MKYRLVPVSPEIKAHPLWEGSMEQLDFLYGGGIQYAVQVERISRRKLADDLTQREQTWIALWEQQF